MGNLPLNLIVSIVLGLDIVLNLSNIRVTLVYQLINNSLEF